MTYDVTFQPNLSTTDLFVGNPGSVRNCSVSITCGNDTPCGFAGYVTFKAECGDIDETARVLLVDATASDMVGKMVVEDSRAVRLRLKRGEEQFVGYGFDRRYPWHKYLVAYWKSNCSVTVADKSMNPRPMGVEPYYVFCDRRTDRNDYA